MEVKGAINIKPMVWAFEAMGTGMMMVVYNMTWDEKYKANFILCMGIIQTINIIFFGQFSNAHCNPALTIAVRLIFRDYTVYTHGQLHYFKLSKTYLRSYYLKLTEKREEVCCFGWKIILA